MMTFSQMTSSPTLMVASGVGARVQSMKRETPLSSQPSPMLTLVSSRQSTMLTSLPIVVQMGLCNSTYSATMRRSLPKSSLSPEQRIISAANCEDRALKSTTLPSPASFFTLARTFSPNVAPSVVRMMPMFSMRTPMPRCTSPSKRTLRMLLRSAAEKPSATITCSQVREQQPWLSNREISMSVRLLYVISTLIYSAPSPVYSFQRKSL